MGIHRSHKKFDTFPVAWHGCVLDWASPRWCFPLPPSRNSRRGETPSILATIRIDGFAPKSREQELVFYFILFFPPPVLFMTYDDRPFDDSWITLAINHHVESSILNRKQMIFFTPRDSSIFRYSHTDYACVNIDVYCISQLWKWITIKF